MTARPLAVRVRRGQLLLHRLVRSGQEDDFAVGRLGHGLHGLQIADLHRGRRGQDVRRLPHQLGRLHFGAGGDDFRLADPLRLRRHAQGVLQLGAEDDVLDQHALDLHAPSRCDLLDDFANGLRNLLAAFDDVLQHAGSHDMPQGGLGALDQGLADVGDAESGLVGGDDVVVDHGGEVQVDVIFGHAHLLWHL